MKTIEIDCWYKMSIDDIVKTVRDNNYEFIITVKESELENFLLYWATKYTMSTKLIEHYEKRLITALWKGLFYNKETINVGDKNVPNMPNIHVSVNVAGIKEWYEEMLKEQVIFIDGKKYPLLLH